MMAMIGRCPKCRQITDDWDGKTTKIKGINNVYKVDHLLCDDCGDLGKGVMFTFLAGLLNTKEIDNITKQYEKLYKEFLNEKLKENKMSISIRRNAEGKVTTGKSTFKVPKNRSFLSVLGNNPAAHGDDFREDGWVYNDGKKVRKWFVSLKDGYPRHIWEPKLEDVVTLESKYHEIHSKLKKFWEGEYNRACEEIKKAGTAHAKPTHKFSSADDGKNWWLYKVSFYGGARDERFEPSKPEHRRGINDDVSAFPLYLLDSSVGWNWVYEPEEPINLEIGQRYYNVGRKNTRWCGYLGRFRASLEESIIRFLQRNVSPEDDKVVDLVINGRRYIYLCILNHYGCLTFKKETWPGDKYEQITM